MWDGRRGGRRERRGRSVDEMLAEADWRLSEQDAGTEIGRNTSSRRGIVIFWRGATGCWRRAHQKGAGGLIRGSGRRSWRASICFERALHKDGAGQASHWNGACLLVQRDSELLAFLYNTCMTGEACVIMQCRLPSAPVCSEGHRLLYMARCFLCTDGARAVSSVRHFVP